MSDLFKKPLCIDTTLAFDVDEPEDITKIEIAEKKENGLTVAVDVKNPKVVITYCEDNTITVAFKAEKHISEFGKMDGRIGLNKRFETYGDWEQLPITATAKEIREALDKCIASVKNAIIDGGKPIL